MSALTTAAPSKDAFAALRSRYERDGYLQLDSVTTPEDVAHIRSLLEPLFQRFDDLEDYAVDLAGPRQPGAPPRQPEINDALKLEPALRKTQAFARCREIARGLLGVPVGCVFDHAIYKPPHNQAATPWHQDAIYIQGSVPRALNFWIPLQAATVENGCMWYLPGSHLAGLRPHHVVQVRPGGETGYSKGKTYALDVVDEARAVACPVPVGGVTVHGPLNAHYAGPNTTDGWRRAWILHFAAYGKLNSKLRALTSR